MSEESRAAFRKECVERCKKDYDNGKYIVCHEADPDNPGKTRLARYNPFKDAFELHDTGGPMSGIKLVM